MAKRRAEKPKSLKEQLEAVKALVASLPADHEFVRDPKFAALVAPITHNAFTRHDREEESDAETPVAQ